MLQKSTKNKKDIRDYLLLESMAHGSESDKLEYIYKSTIDVDVIAGLHSKTLMLLALEVFVNCIPHWTTPD